MKLINITDSIVAINRDVSQKSDVKATINQIIDQFDKLDIAFNNAGVQSPMTNIAYLSSEDYDRTMTINLKGI